MTPREAALRSGYSRSQILELIRQGKIKAKRKSIPGGFVYDVSLAEVTKLLKRGKDNRGRKSINPVGE
jgi:hypothetical protein